jgi:hypothetical protein
MVCSKMETLLHCMVAGVAVCKLGDEWAWIVSQGMKNKLVADNKKGLGEQSDVF